MSLYQDWQAANKSPFYPYIGKNNQFLVGFALLAVGKSCHVCRWWCSKAENADSNRYIAFVYTGLFGLSECHRRRQVRDV